MDLRAYYRRIREIAEELHEDCVVIVSRATSDGGRAGIKTDVPRALAAKLIAEEKADAADEEEAAEFRAEVERMWKHAAD
jgi:sugar phosphate isomerase/epimerase